VYYRLWWEGDVTTYFEMQQVVELNFWFSWVILNP
jgi:hypothetical protein